MARYVFNIVNGESPPESISLDLPDFDAVRREALRAACLSITDNADRFWQLSEWQMIVTDANGLMLFNLHMNATMAPVAMRQSPRMEAPR
jgi:hypothetical protein